VETGARSKSMAMTGDTKAIGVNDSAATVTAILFRHLGKKFGFSDGVKE
jgi:hypothetical protein